MNLSVPILHSELSQREIENNFKDVDLFSGIMSGLEEVLAYKKGATKAATYTRKRELPEIDVTGLRKSLNLSQKMFATILGVSVRTVEAWETGRSNPSPTARNLMFLIDSDSTLIAKLQKARHV